MEHDSIYIFGAHSRARTAGVYLTELHPGLSVRAYLVDDGEENPQEIGGAPVLHIGPDSVLDTKLPVYIGTRGASSSSIRSRLESLGMETVIPVTPELDMQLRNDYLRQHYARMGRSFPKIGGAASAAVYVARSAFDRELKQEYRLAPYQVEIRAGAALAEKRSAGAADDTGWQISARNRQFCELTVLYWIWKNAGEDIVGLEHYRRHFLLPEDWRERMAAEKIDAILPTPLYVSPGIAQNYKDRHDAGDWDYMMETLRFLYPEDYESAEAFFDTNLYSPCNMFIMKKEVLNELCAWMFPVLFACAEHGGERTDPYRNRYPGFLAERLLTFFFEKNRNRFRVVYADKNFLE